MDVSDNHGINYKDEGIMGTIILYADGNEEDCDSDNRDLTFSSIPDPVFSSIWFGGSGLFEWRWSNRSQAQIMVSNGIFDENPCLFMKRILCEAIETYSVTSRKGRNNYWLSWNSNQQSLNCMFLWLNIIDWFCLINLWVSEIHKLLLSTTFNSSKTEIRFPVNLGITGHVATTGEVLWDVNFVKWSIK